MDARCTRGHCAACCAGDPNVILHRRDRDEEPSAPRDAAEPATSVLSTIRTVNASKRSNHMIDFFPPHVHQQVRAILTGTLKMRPGGVVDQQQRGLDPADRRQRPRHDIEPAETGRLEVVQSGGSTDAHVSTRRSSST